MLEPFCQSAPPMRSFDTSNTYLVVASNGTIRFEASPNGMGGMGFEIKYECPAATTTTTPKPCKNIKAPKWCKKQKKNGKCNVAYVWTKCRYTCEKCDSKLGDNLPQHNFSMKTQAITTTKPWGDDSISQT